MKPMARCTVRGTACWAIRQLRQNAWPHSTCHSTIVHAPALANTLVGSSAASCSDCTSLGTTTTTRQGSLNALGFLGPTSCKDGNSCQRTCVHWVLTNLATHSIHASLTRLAQGHCRAVQPGTHEHARKLGVRKARSVATGMTWGVPTSINITTALPGLTGHLSNGPGRAAQPVQAYQLTGPTWQHGQHGKPPAHVARVA